MNNFTPRHEGAFGIYLNQVRHLPELSHEQVNTLIEAYQTTGNITTRNKVVEAHLLYVISVAKQYQTATIELSDLIEEGNLGLIEAVEHYDPTVEVPFILYASYWMRKYITAFIHRYKHCVTRPLYQDIDIYTNSLDGSSREEDDDYAAENSIRDLQSEQSHSFRNDAIRRAVYQALDTLSDKEAQVIRLSFGIGCNPEPDTVISKRLNISSEERVRQLREQALCKLEYRIDKSLIV